MALNKLTAKDALDRWVANLRDLFDRIAAVAEQAGWSRADRIADAKEDPFSLGASIAYGVPVMVLTRPGCDGADEQSVTFEPRHRFTIGAAGRIDVYSSPALGEAMLLRIPNTNGVEDLTWEEAEERVEKAPWCAYSQERHPLDYNLDDDDSLLALLEELVRRQ